MSQSELHGGSPGSQVFDGYDDVADDVHEPHDHAPISTGYQPGTGRRVALTAVALSSVFAGAYLLVSLSKGGAVTRLEAAVEAKKREAPLVEAVSVMETPPTQTLVLPAEARGWYASTIYARVSGYLTKWEVDIGDRVKKNQVLAVVDTPELDAQLDAAKAQLKAAEANLKVKESEAEFAKTTFERWSGSAKGVVSEQEREDKKAQLASALARLNEAEAKVNIDKSNIERLSSMAQYKSVVAPFDGVITQRRIDVGDLVTAGSTSNTSPLFSIAQYDNIRIFVNAPQGVAGDITVGSRAIITSVEHPDQTYEGKVSRTSEALDPRSLTLRVEVDIENKNLKLLPGMYLKAEFKLKSKAPAQIPASALIFRNSGPQVALITPDNTVKFKDVRIARDNGTTIEVDTGLSVGDRVALNINNQIQDGAKVSARETRKIAAK